MTEIFFQTATYDYSNLKPKLFEIMEHLAHGLIRKGGRVLIKPNFLAPAGPKEAIITHPLVVKAVVEYVLDKGGRPCISDSPIGASFKKILREGGHAEALSGLDVKIEPFRTSVKKNIGKPFKRIDIARGALEADILINLPKLKTHAQMLLTLGVKNLFGCIVGLRKPEWHLRAGIDREMFAKLLVSVCNTVNPALTILDGILALEGNGPGRSGKPRNVGVLVGSVNAPALDMAVCRMLGIDPEKLPTHKVASDLGLIQDEIDITGDFYRVEKFEIPVLSQPIIGPRPFRNIMRKHLIQRPVVQPSLCKLCDKCREYCPANAITRKTREFVFDYNKCIRCYCCIEMCPHGAIHAEETSMGKIFRKILPT